MFHARDASYFQHASGDREWCPLGTALAVCYVIFERLKVHGLKVLSQRLNLGSALLEKLQIHSEAFIRQVHGTPRKSAPGTAKVLKIEFHIEKRHVNKCVAHVVPLLKSSHGIQGKGTPSAKLTRYSCVKHGQ
jgi:hypothetical protein